MSKELNKEEIRIVKEQAREKLGLCRKANDIIGTQVFSILGLYARVIYYPLGEGAPWGFTRISGSKNEGEQKKPFVVINTSIPIDCQAFAAAHELYHIWYRQDPDVLPGNLLDEVDRKTEEKKASRFAAEFLVDEAMLKQEIDTYEIKTITIKEVLLLAELFTVPYRAMVKRLHEIKKIKEKERESLLAESEESIRQHRKRYAIPVIEADNRIAMDNLAELSVNAYEKGLITAEKMEYLLRMCALRAEDLGITTKEKSIFPSDEELDRIMEEDE